MKNSPNSEKKKIHPYSYERSLIKNKSTHSYSNSAKELKTFGLDNLFIKNTPLSELKQTFTYSGSFNEIEKKNSSEQTITIIDPSDFHNDEKNPNLFEKSPIFNINNNCNEWISVKYFDNNVNHENDPKYRKYFFLQEKINYLEDKNVEYKEYLIPYVDLFKKKSQANNKIYSLNFKDEDKITIIQKTICAFLNTDGGRIYFGINDNGIVTGVKLNFMEKDKFKNYFRDITRNFWPQCHMDKLSVYYVPVKKKDNSQFIKDLYVVKLRILKGKPDFLYSIYFRPYDSFIRADNQVLRLKCENILEEIIKRSRLKKTENWIDEEVEIEPEIPKNDKEIAAIEIEDNSFGKNLNNKNTFNGKSEEKLLGKKHYRKSSNCLYNNGYFNYNSVNNKTYIKGNCNDNKINQTTSLHKWNNQEYIKKYNFNNNSNNDNFYLKKNFYDKNNEKNLNFNKNIFWNNFIKYNNNPIRNELIGGNYLSNINNEHSKLINKNQAGFINNINNVNKLNFEANLKQLSNHSNSKQLNISSNACLLSDRHQDSNSNSRLLNQEINGFPFQKNNYINLNTENINNYTFANTYYSNNQISNFYKSSNTINITPKRRDNYSDLDLVNSLSQNSKQLFEYHKNNTEDKYPNIRKNIENSDNLKNVDYFCYKKFDEENKTNKIKDVYEKNIAFKNTNLDESPSLIDKKKKIVDLTYDEQTFKSNFHMSKHPIEKEKNLNKIEDYQNRNQNTLKNNIFINDGKSNNNSFNKVHDLYGFINNNKDNSKNSLKIANKIDKINKLESSDYFSSVKNNITSNIIKNHKLDLIPNNYKYKIKDKFYKKDIDIVPKSINHLLKETSYFQEEIPYNNYDLKLLNDKVKSKTKELNSIIEIKKANQNKNSSSKSQNEYINNEKENLYKSNFNKKEISSINSRKKEASKSCSTSNIFQEDVDKQFLLDLNNDQEISWDCNNNNIINISANKNKNKYNQLSNKSFDDNEILIELETSSDDSFIVNEEHYNQNFEIKGLKVEEKYFPLDKMNKNCFNKEQIPNEYYYLKRKDDYLCIPSPKSISSLKSKEYNMDNSYLEDEEKTYEINDIHLDKRKISNVSSLENEMSNSNCILMNINNFPLEFTHDDFDKFLDEIDLNYMKIASTKFEIDVENNCKVGKIVFDKNEMSYVNLIFRILDGKRVKNKKLCVDIE